MNCLRRGSKQKSMEKAGEAEASLPSVKQSVNAGFRSCGGAEPAPLQINAKKERSNASIVYRAISLARAEVGTF